MKLLKGDVVAAGIKAAVKEEVQALCAKGGRAPHVAIVEAAEDSAAHMYIGQVERTFKQVGIESARVELRIGAGTDELVATIQRLAKDDGVNGILLPTPLPRKMSLIAAQDALPPDKDIEGISSLNVGRLALGQPKSIPATPLGGMEILRHYGIPVEGRRAVVLGRSPVVGWPMATLLQQAGATITVCHSRTRDLPAVTREADILVSAAGRPKLISADMVRKGAVVIDFGVNMTEGGMCGDVDFDAVAPLVDAITPVPGGTGPVTAAVLVRNVVDATRRQQGGWSKGLGLVS
ncbi:MAG TPA: bifunctional 5,10-methylenetetrahydrofolate dehydrogenase/5,10-methenyltetrahydrofolate cyclohydrolase [Chloroflexota bacterium]|nr:bifunctional 5,10-methylenetetrahydrofolate dehydrogenase/5,10-methenyltetrahydrofolate cyclohydrolase [Chloroflexota bacterium]